MDSEERFIVDSCASALNLPKQFCELVVRSEPLNIGVSVQHKIEHYIERLKFLDVAMRAPEESALNDEMEFYVVALAHDVNGTIELARLVIFAEMDELIEEEKQIIVRRDRFHFLVKVFVFFGSPSKLLFVIFHCHRSLFNSCAIESIRF